VTSHHGRVNVMIQFVSHVFPLSSEKACSHCAEWVVGRVQRNRHPVLECAIAELFEDGLIQRHVRKMRRIYRARLDTLAAALRTELGRFLTFREPSGGTAIWVRTRDARTMTRLVHIPTRRAVVVRRIPGQFRHSFVTRWVTTTERIVSEGSRSLRQLRPFLQRILLPARHELLVETSDHRGTRAEPATTGT
jgi:hypothetical protein